MKITFTPAYRALAAGGTAAAALIGAFALGSTAGNAAPTPVSQRSSGTGTSAVLTSSPGSARITVTGTGTVTGMPDQLTLSMGVQVSAPSVGSALQQANQAVRRVTGALRARGVAAADIQTSGLSIQPNYRANSQIPDGYGVSESLNATLRRLRVAGAEIDAAVRAGGNVATVDGISLNLTDTSGLLARARAAAVADAKVKATQYARALGQPLGPVVSITDQAPAQPLPFDASKAAASGASPVPISPGTQQLSLSVTAVYATP
ncbi:MAG TPA: SIMPL domain-containing protein [Streptosporangiaceae bacterium]|jgi:hypothetical protein